MMNDFSELPDGVSLKSMSPPINSTEVVVALVDYSRVSVDKMPSIYEELVKKFPENTVVMLPDFMSLTCMSKDVLENYISMVAEILEELQSEEKREE